MPAVIDRVGFEAAMGVMLVALFAAGAVALLDRGLAVTGPMSAASEVELAAVPPVS